MKTDIKDLQDQRSLLFNWIKYKKSVSWEQLKNGAKRISYDKECNINHVYNIILPLLYSGLIEFIGQGKYMISPPVAFNYENSDTVIFINCNDFQKKCIYKNIINYNEDFFGIIRCSKEHLHSDNEITEILPNINTISVLSMLNNFPKITKLTPYARDGHISPKIFWNVKKYKWDDTLYCDQGLCKIEKDTPAVFWKHKGGFFSKLHAFSDNPDAQNIMKLQQASLENHVYLSYNRKAKELHIKGQYLPILLNRVLSLKYIDSELWVRNTDFNIIYHNINKKEVSQIKRILSTTIEYTNE